MRGALYEYLTPVGLRNRCVNAAIKPFSRSINTAQSLDVGRLLLFAMTIVFVFVCSHQAQAAMATSHGTDVYGFDRRGTYTDGEAILFRGGLAAFKARQFGQARAIWEYTARFGNAPSQYMLGHMYKNGWGVDANIKNAYAWYLAAATQQVPAAEFRLGLAFFRVGDMDNAVTWWRKSANGGYTAAQYNMGLIYLYGHGLDKNTDEAEQWLRRAAIHGSAHAQFYIGVMYLKGEGVDENIDVAKSWFTKSADNGFEYVKQDLQEIKDGVVMPIFAQ